jgi:hypothetical protein
MSNFNAMSGSKFAKYMPTHPVPVVLGPNASLFVTDHHHLLAGLGLSSRAGADAYFCVTADFSAHETKDFFALMQHFGLLRLKDRRAGNITLDQLPTSISAMNTDDPYRSAMECVSVACERASNNTIDF